MRSKPTILKSTILGLAASLGLIGSSQAQITADFEGSTPGAEGAGNVDLSTNLDAGTVGATWSALGTTGGEVTVTSDAGGLSSQTRNSLTGNYLYIGKKSNDSSHSSTATLTFDTPQTLAGTVFSLNAEMDNSGAQASKGLMIDIYDGMTLLASINFGNSSNPGYRYSIGEMDATDALVQNLFSTASGSRVWQANDTGAVVTFNFGASDYTVGAVSEINGDLGLSPVLSYLNTAGATFDRIVFTADRSKASWALDNLFIGVPATIPAELDAESPQQFTNNGAAETLLIPFSNVGTGTDLNIIGVTLSAGDTGFFTAPTVWTADVAPNGGTGTISLPFDPTLTGGGPGSYTVDLEVSSNGEGSPQTITVNVAVIDPVAVVTPSAVDFGTDPATFTMDVNIENTGGSTTLTIYSISVVDDPDGVFSVGAIPGDGTIAPGANADVTVTYTPGATAGYFTGTLEIDTDSDPSTQSLFKIPLSVRETGAAVTAFTADFEGSTADTAGIVTPSADWLTTPANLALGSAGGGWSGLSTAVTAPSTQFTGVGVSSGIATGMTGNWLLFGNTGNTEPFGSTDKAHTYASIELDSPMPLVDGTAMVLDMNMLNSGGQPGHMWITGRDASGTALFQIIAGNGLPLRSNLMTASDDAGTVDETLTGVWNANNTAVTVELALDAAAYTVTADGGTSIIAGSYLAAGDLASIEFHAIDSKARWGIDNISIEPPSAVKMKIANPQQFANDGSPETLIVDFSNVGISDPLDITGITLSGFDFDDGYFTEPTVWTAAVAANGGTGTIELPFDPTDGGEGFFEVTLTVASNDIYHPTRVMKVQVNVEIPAGYAVWAGTFMDLTDTNPELDFESDGLATGIEWVVGGDPTVNDAAAITPTFDNASDPDNFLYTFRRTFDAYDDLGTTIVVEYGSDLLGWRNTADHGATDGVTTTPLDVPGEDYDLVTVAIPRTLATDGTLFARLKVTVTP